MSIKQWCPITRSANIIGDRWSLLILRELAASPMRFKTLKANIPGISMDQLTRKLDLLCRTQMIVRQEYSEAPPRVEYQLTDLGTSFTPVLRRLFLWSSQNIWGEKQKDEFFDSALTLRLVATFLGRGEGRIGVSIRSSVEEQAGQWTVERHHSEFVSIDQGLLANCLSVIELGYMDWKNIVARKSFETPITVNGKVTGHQKLLVEILPVFQNIKFENHRQYFKEKSTSPEINSPY